METNVETELRALVQFDTVSDPTRDRMPTSDCPRYIASRFKSLGYPAEVLDNRGVYSVIARRGDGPLDVLFLAHFDVVPVSEGWETNPFELVVRGDKAFGRGTCDDKGNIVSMIVLAERLRTEKVHCSVMFAATGDEEVGGSRGAGFLRDYLSRKGIMPRYVIVADGIGQQIIFRRRNVLPTTIRVPAKSSKTGGQEETVRFVTDTFGSESRHSAYMQPGVDRHAMLAASKYLDLHPHTVVRGVRGAFIKSNVVPDWVELDVVHQDRSGAESQYDEGLTGLIRSLLAVAHAGFPTKYSERGVVISPNVLKLDARTWDLYCDIRAMTNDSASVKAALEMALQNKVTAESVRVDSGAGYVDSDVGSKLIRTACWSMEKEGLGCQLIEGFGASDSRYFSGVAQVFDIGPVGDNLHGSNEWVSLSSIRTNADFFLRLLQGLGRSPEELK